MNTKVHKIVAAALAAIPMTACSAERNVAPEKDAAAPRGKALVAYFSATGVTKGVAEKLSTAIGADLYEIVPEKPYTGDDLNWRNKQSRSSVEMADRASRPAIAGEKLDIAQYDAVFIGFPIWWGREPSVVDTFLDAHDFAGKTVIPFATSGGSGIGGTAKEIGRVAPKARVLDGRVFRRGVSGEDLAKWALPRIPAAKAAPAAAMCGADAEAIEEARRLILAGDAKCVIIRDGKIAHSEIGSGVSPLLDACDALGEGAKGGVLVDKVIGRAAAAIALEAGIARVHAELLGEDARALLEGRSVPVTATRVVPAILNRDLTRLCPMETAVRGLSDPSEMCKTVRAAVARMKAGEKLPMASVVYFTHEITPDGVVNAYKALNRDLSGRKVSVKISTGEAGNRHYLKPALIGKLVESLGGDIVECNTAYGGSRMKTSDHRKTIEDHGFNDIAKVVIMDEFAQLEIPTPEGSAHFGQDLIGAAFTNYNGFVILSHFKGHQMGGFGGALKNISIGIASSSGKARIHSAGKTDDTATLWSSLPAQKDFIESMAEAAGAVANYMGDRAVYVNVMNNISIDCDCNGNPAKPEMDDVGILSSLDPIALDRACVDLVYASDPVKSASLRKRMEDMLGAVILSHGEELGYGQQNYVLVSLDGCDKAPSTRRVD